MNETSNWINVRNENALVVCNWDTMKRKMWCDTVTMFKRQNQLRDSVHFKLSQKLFISNGWYRCKLKIQYKQETNQKKNSSSNCTKFHRNRAHLIRPFYRRKRIVLFRLFLLHRFISIAIARKIVLKHENTYFAKN